MIVDLFAGPGGWDLGARAIGLPDPIGVEYDAAACATRAEVGLRTIRADVATLPVDHLHGKVAGLIASPPCKAFSKAGKREGTRHVAALIDAIRSGDWAARPSPDPLVWLALEVGRWAEALRPEWVALEQVPEALPLWQTYAHRLEDLGYSVWTGNVTTEQYGVPQTRRRALLIASRTHRVGAPPPTHEKYVPRSRRRQDQSLGFLLPYVTMGQALGLADSPDALWLCDTRGDSDRDRDTFEVGDAPSRVITAKSYSWRMRGTSRTTKPLRGEHDPAPTMAFGHDGPAFVLHSNRGQDADGNRQTRDGDEPAPAFTAKSGGQWKIAPQEERLPGLAGQRVAADVADWKPWADERPATAIAGRALVPEDPGANANRHNGSTKSRNDGIKVTVRQALILQAFPPDYPVQGNQSKRYEQVGNAVPPLLAAHVLAMAAGVAPPDPREDEP